MTFVNPWLLAGGALIAVPIVLHLIMRRKPRHFEFPALRFIQRRHKTNQRRLRLRHLLLLALRVVAILLLAAALARPSVKLSGTWGSQEAPVAAALVFDTSRRMEYQHENRTRLEVARELGLWLLAQFPPDSQIAVLDTWLPPPPQTDESSSPSDTQTAALDIGRGPPAFQVDRGAAKHRIERLETMANSQSLTSTLEDAVQVLEGSELKRREIYLFTDMARVSWPRESAAHLQGRLAKMPDLGIYVVDVGVDNPTNSALGELRLSGQVLSTRSPLRIETEISHRGASGERTVELQVLAPASDQSKQGPLAPQKRSEKIVALEPGQSQQVSLEIRNLEAGTHQGYVQIVGQDGLPCDDKRFFTVEVKPAWRILVAAPKPAKWYARFWTKMLAPTDFRRTGRARFDCEVIALEDLPGRSLGPYAAVCLLDPTSLAPLTWQKLGDFVSDGHGLAIFLGRNAKPIDSFSHPAAQELLPGRLLRWANWPDGDLHLAPRDLEHPILATLRGYAGGIPWASLPVYRYWQLAEPADGVHVVVPFNNGEPAILERPLGRGRVITVTTPISDDPNQQPWNLLPVDQAWPFFIIANEMMSHLVGGKDRQLNYFAGQRVALGLDPERTFRSYVLTALDYPDDPAVRLTPDLREHVLVVTSTDRVGNYRVQAGGSDMGVDRGFSVNLTPEQTELDRLSEEEIAEVFGSLPFRVARDRTQIEGDRSMQRVGRELFPFLILLLALTLGAEHVVANRFYKE